MPLIQNSAYQKAPYFLFNGQLQTLYPGLLRFVKGINYQRERLVLSDGDFLDLDWIKNKSDHLVILSHGLEGHSNSSYIKGMAKLFLKKDWDVLAWNCRSCGGEMNLKLRLYNHGEIGDIEEVIQHALQQKSYKSIVLIGFSMGGNINSKFLGVLGNSKKYPIKCSVAISAPFDLGGSASTLDIPSNNMYKKYFLSQLKKKITIKAQNFPDIIDLNNFNRIKKWEDFDHFFSAPLNGYKNAQDLYDQGSASNYIEDLRIPTLLLNAQNDPILTDSCSPTSIAKDHSFLYLENPKHGGHVGFMQKGLALMWSEIRALEFVNQFVREN